MQTRKTTRRRLITVVLAPTAALAAWGAAKALGAELVLKGGATVDASDVVLAAFVAALAAWLVARWIEHHTRRPRAVWAFISSTALAISGIGPTDHPRPPGSAE